MAIEIERKFLVKEKPFRLEKKSLHIRQGYIVKGYIGPRTEEIFYQDLKPYLSS